MVAAWNKTTLPKLVSHYKLENIYNADEFGLSCLPVKFYHLKSEKSSWGKHSQLGIIALAATNGAGENIPIFVIGKSKNARYSKNVKSLPCRYSWMLNGQ